MSQVAFDFDLDDGGEPDVHRRRAGRGDQRRAAPPVHATGVWVRGEIQGWSERGRHAYFNLVEVDDRGRQGHASTSQFFANARMRLRPMLPQAPAASSATG